MSETQKIATVPGQIMTPEQQEVLDAIGYGDDLPEMDAATRDDLLGKGLIEVDGGSYRMPEAVHRAWFMAMASLPMNEEDHD